MKVFLVLTLVLCFWLSMSLIVLADGDLKFDDPGPARSLPRSERKRLRLLKLQNEHRIKKRDVNNNEELSLSITTNKSTLNTRGNIKAIDSIQQNSLKDGHNFAEGKKDFKFAYNLDDHNRNEILHLIRAPKELLRDDSKEEEIETVEAKGSFSFISADGFKYITKYIADNKGFRPIVLVEKI